MEKNWIYSKTIWVNVFALGAALAQAKYGWVVNPETEASFLAIVNVVLRSITKQGITY